MNTGGFPKPSVRHWIVTPIGGEREGGVPARGHRRGRLPGQVARDTGHLQQAAVRRRRPALPGRPVDPVGRPAGHHHADHGDRAARDAAHRGHRARAGARALPVHLQAGGQDEGGREAVRFWETQKITLPLVDADEVVRLAVRAPADLVPAAAELARRHAVPARAVRSAARLGRPAVAAPLHGRRRAARRDAGAAGGALRGDPGAGGERRGHGEVRHAVGASSARRSRTVPEEGRRVRRVLGSPEVPGPRGRRAPGRLRWRSPGQASASILRVSRQQLRQHLRVADDRHEVRVAAPARDDVLVQVGGDAGARRPSPGSCRC